MMSLGDESGRASGTLRFHEVVHSRHVLLSTPLAPLRRLSPLSAPAQTRFTWPTTSAVTPNGTQASFSATWCVIEGKVECEEGGGRPH
jgi:hypothetical protein